MGQDCCKVRPVPKKHVKKIKVIKETAEEINYKLNFPNLSKENNKEEIDAINKFFSLNRERDMVQIIKCFMLLEDKTCSI